MLERGHLLRGGELLADADGTHLIRVLAAPERCRRCAAPTRTCWPRRLPPGQPPCAAADRTRLLRFQHDHVLDDMLRGLGLTVEAEQAPFEPEAGATKAHPMATAMLMATITRSYACLPIPELPWSNR
jgi:urease accessory protein